VPTDTALSASLEDYLETISQLEASKRVARAKEIASTLGVTRPSVTGALRALAAKGLVNYDPYSLVTLTADGQRAARRVIGRHKALARFLGDVLGLDEDVAQANACRLEHSLDGEVLARLKKFVEFIDACPLGGDKFKQGFKQFCGSCDACRCMDCAKAAVSKARNVSGRHP